MMGVKHCTYVSKVMRRKREFRAKGPACLIFFLLFFLFCCGSASCQTLAVFPLLDLTVGPNGTNPLLTGYIRREAEVRGFELVDEQEIMQFMILHRIRSLGSLTTHQINLAGEELGADLVLQGTVCQLQDNPPTTVSLNLQLIRTTDASLAWARTEGLYYADLLSLLGLSDPKIMDDLYRVFFARLFDDIPSYIQLEGYGEESLDIDTVVLRPAFVRPGEIVDCKIRLFAPRHGAGELPRVVARVGDEEHPLTLDQEGYYYEASWPAQNREGEYSVTLTGTWPSGKSRSSLIGTYSVDTHAPGVSIHVAGKPLNGKTAFNNALVIMPRLINPEPISRWLIQVINQQGEVIVNQGASQHIPWRFTWRGQASNGTLAPDGDYRIFFTVWDRVGWESSAEAEVSYLRMPPEINVDVSRENGAVTVNLQNVMTTPVSFWWMKFFDKTGRQLKLAQGEVLPAAIELQVPPSEEDEESVLEGLLQVCDVMGNKTSMQIKNLLLLEEAGEAGEVNLEMEWVEEF